MPSRADPAREQSSQMLSGTEHAPQRAMLRAIGLKDHDFERPLIGIANIWSGAQPCNYYLREIAKGVEEGVSEAGGTPLEFDTVAVNDAMAMGPSENIEPEIEIGCEASSVGGKCAQLKNIGIIERIEGLEVHLSSYQDKVRDLLNWSSEFLGLLSFFFLKRSTRSFAILGQNNRYHQPLRLIL